MVIRRNKTPEPSPKKRKPATTPEGRENQLVHLAVELAESQLRAGTASAQVISHYLKLGSTRERLEQERLDGENKLLAAKIDAMASAKKMEELYARAISAMRSYSAQDSIEDPDDYED